MNFDIKFTIRIQINQWHTRWAYRAPTIRCDGAVTPHGHLHEVRNSARCPGGSNNGSELPLVRREKRVGMVADTDTVIGSCPRSDRTSNNGYPIVDHRASARNIGECMQHQLARRRWTGRELRVVRWIVQVANQLRPWL